MTAQLGSRVAPVRPRSGREQAVLHEDARTRCAKCHAFRIRSYNENKNVATSESCDIDLVSAVSQQRSLPVGHKALYFW
jgi:hypothetical protein